MSAPNGPMLSISGMGGSQQLQYQQQQFAAYGAQQSAQQQGAQQQQQFSAYGAQQGAPRVNDPFGF